MPKQTFFNLSEEKKQVIITVARKEFSRVPLYEASIANIVKDADISRGSFYQYFEDKEDLFFYVLNLDAQARQKKFMSSLQSHQGDIFATMKEMFQLMLIELEDEELRSFYQNIFLHLNYKTEKTLVNNMAHHDFNKHYEQSKPLIDTTNLNVTNEEEVFHIVQIISSVMLQNFVLKFAKELSNDEVLRNYETQMHLLKKGFLK